MIPLAPLVVGAVIDPRNFGPITQEHLHAYARASGDPNLIHLDPEVAKKMGLPGVIAHGMLTAAFVAERARGYVLEEVGHPAGSLLRYQSRFRAMVFLGDRVTVSGTVKEVLADQVTLELHAKNQREEVVVTAVAVWVIS